MKLLYSFYFLILLRFLTLGQSPNIPFDRDYYQLIDRIEVISGESLFHSSIKPYTRISVGKLTDGLKKSSENKENIDWIRYENKDYSAISSERKNNPLFSKFYKKSSNALSVYDKKLTLHLNPLVYASVGKEIGNSSEPLYRNSRGIEIYGNIMNKLGFYTSVTENQVLFPSYVKNYISANTVIPGEAFWKKFNENGVDYFNTTGYFSFNLIEPINLQFGYDRQFIGNGYRSLILSDFSAPSLYLKLTTDVWRISYTNLFRELTSDIIPSGGVPKGNDVYPKKYMALHHLNFHVSKKLDIGLFESIIFQRNDTNSLELNYLNPLIFYRSIEQNLGSPDNALLGMDFKWNFAKKLSLYGQIVLDELIVKEVTSRNGWWGNKQSGQIGLKYFNAFNLEGFDLQGELNVVRPYMYTHTDNTTSYTHYRQPLAHPLGANFYELVGIAKYKPMSKLSATGVLVFSKFGSDTGSTNVGSNLLLDNSTRDNEYGNKIGQGVSSSLLIMDLTLSYRLRDNWFVDLRQIFRNVSSDNSSIDGYSYLINLGVRLHMGRKDYHF